MPHANRTNRSYLAVVMIGAILVLSGCTSTTDRRLVEGVVEEWTEAPFYTLPDPVPAGKPGEIVRSEAIKNAPDGASAWRVLYHSIDVLGADVIVSGVIVAPDGPAPEGGRVIVSWGHPTTGAAQKCAPSVGIDPFDTIEGLEDLLHAGYVVASTDYPGMGAAGPDAYLIGVTEGNSVLDAARAARNISATGAGSRLLLWGHSQGGQAALFAAERASGYAPELSLAGVAVAAPAADLGALLNSDIGDVSGVTIASYAFHAYASVYGPSTPGTRLDTILTPAGAAQTDAMAAMCLGGQHLPLHALARPLIGNYLAHDPAATEPWKTLLAANTPGSVKLTVPLFVAQGATDALVHPESTRAFAERECSIGSAVTYLSIPDTGHGLVALRALPTLMPWFRDALGGTAPGAASALCASR